jgi:hypothetical protein
VKRLPQSGLWPKLAECRRRVISIEKDSRNQHGGYDYVSAEAMISKTRAAMLEHGLVFYRDDASLVDMAGVLVLKQRFCLIDADSYQSHTFVMDLPCPARKGMPEDKAVMAALTSGLNYAIRDLLMVSRGREDQIEALNDAGFDPGKAPPAPPEPARGPKQGFTPGSKKNHYHAANVEDQGSPLTEFELRILKEFIPAIHERGDGCFGLWMSSASKWWSQKHIGETRVFSSVDELPPEFARAVIRHFQPEIQQWKEQIASE